MERKNIRRIGGGMKLTKDELAEIRVILWRFYDFLSQGRWTGFAPYMFNEKEWERVKELAEKVEKVEKEEK